MGHALGAVVIEVARERGLPAGADRTAAGRALEEHAIYRIPPPGKRLARVPLPAVTARALLTYVEERLALLNIITPVLPKGDTRKAALRETWMAARLLATLKQRSAADGSIEPCERL